MSDGGMLMDDKVVEERVFGGLDCKVSISRTKRRIERSEVKGPINQASFKWSWSKGMQKKKRGKE